MWTHADKMWTDADSPQKCGQMRTINADNKKCGRDPLHAKSNGMVPYGTIHLRSGERAQYFGAIKLALLSV